MNFVSYANSVHELGQLKEAGIQEVILTNKNLSRVHLAKNTIEKLVHEAKALKLKVVLEWDILCTENDFALMLQEFNKLKVYEFDAVRVQDLGVLEYVLENEKVQIQFIAETGNRNIMGLKKWVSYIGGRLDRLVLSIELSKGKLEEISRALNCELEVLAIGRILLFYSPRKLLSALLPEEDEKKQKNLVSEDFIEALGESEESPHKGFPIIENQHGTFMFHIKDLFLLDKFNELNRTGVENFRIDFRHKEDAKLFAFFNNQTELENNFPLLKQAYGKETTRGYFNINKSDVLFKKLKNHRIQRKDENYIGEVVEILKGEYLAIDIKGSSHLKINQDLKFITPEGKEMSCKVFFLKDSEFNNCETREKGELALMNYFGGLWPKSQVYLNKNAPG